MSLKMKTEMKYVNLARAAGIAVTSIWIASGDPLPLEHLLAGLELFKQESGNILTDPVISEYLKGGLDYLSAIGLGLAEQAQETGGNIGHFVTRSLDEMREYAGDRAGQLTQWFNQTISESNTFRHWVTQQVKTAPDPVSGSWNLIDTGRGALEALNGIAKAWAVFRIARRVLLWSIDRLRNAQGGPQEAMGEDAVEVVAPESQETAVRPGRAGAAPGEAVEGHSGQPGATAGLNERSEPEEKQSGTEMRP